MHACSLPSPCPQKKGRRKNSFRNTHTTCKPACRSDQRNNKTWAESRVVNTTKQKRSFERKNVSDLGNSKQWRHPTTKKEGTWAAYERQVSTLKPQQANKRFTC
uniref:Uncharacterized protein n=1 Tax=Ixodes ricinus TaxID=34613 RepID=A0A131Y8J4_IXORI